MKKGQELNLFGNCLGFFLAFFFLTIHGCSDYKVKTKVLVSCDTITLPFKTSQVWSVYYHPTLKKTILSFIQESPLTIVYVDPETLSYSTFPLEKVTSSFLNLSHPLSYYVIDSTSAIVTFLNMNDQYFKIGTDGSIQSIIRVVDRREKKDYDIYFYPSLIPYPNQNNDDTLVLAQEFTAEFPRSHLYITDRNVRNKKFSAKTNLVMKYIDSLMIVSNEDGSYPEELVNSADYYYYEPCYSIGLNNQIVNLFPSINKIGYTIEHRTVFQNLQIPNTNRVSTFECQSVMNYHYISQYTYENSIWLYLYSDLKDSCYYAISTIQSEFVNHDGTKNDPVSSPWALVTLNKSLEIKNVSYFDKDELSKHNFFFSSKYMYILSNTLTKENPQKYMTFIKINKY